VSVSTKDARDAISDRAAAKPALSDVGTSATVAYRGQEQAWWRSPTLGLFALALALTIAAAAKPVLWDDEIYFQFAQFIAGHPLDPYGAPIWVAGHTGDGLHVLAPPFLLYWWAGAIALIGVNPSATAVALFPFAAIYVWSFYSLARRFAPALAMPLTAMASLSPWPLLTISYMLDFPAMALELAALALFVQGTETRSWSLLLAAGVSAGLAMETKYNAVGIVGAMLVWGILARRIVDAVLAAAVAMLMFGAVEWLIAAKYGHSHFVINFFATADSKRLTSELSRLRTLLYGVIQNSGPLGIGTLLLLPVVLGDRRAWIAANAVFAVTAFAVSAVGFDRVLGHVIPGATPDRMPMVLTASGLLGIALLIQGARLVVGLRRVLLGDRYACFLLAWLALEVAIYFAMSPFPAARRLGEITDVALLLVGRAAVLGRPELGDGYTVPAAAAVSAACGLVMLVISLIDGRGVEATARAAAAFARDARQGGGAWHETSLGLAHYLDAEGISRIERDVTTLRRGDVLVTDFTDAERVAALKQAGFEPIVTIRAGINLGVGVSTTFYRNANPWFAANDTRAAVMVFRAANPAMVRTERP
jgi:Dolichyl-phosphate-mannose-protein mannosyltransferase